MIFLFFCWADQKPVLWKITLILAQRWGGGLFLFWLDDSLAGGGRLSRVLWTFIHTLPFLSPLTSGTRAEINETLPVLLRTLGCVRSLFTSSPLFVMLLETIVWFPKLMQPALEFSNSCGSRCAGRWGGPGKTESRCSSKLQDSSMTFLIKCSRPTFAVSQSDAFSFLIDVPKLKLLRQTDSEILWMQPTYSSGNEQQLVCSLQPVNWGKGIALCSWCSNMFYSTLLSNIIDIIQQYVKSVIRETHYFRPQSNLPAGDLWSSCHTMLSTPSFSSSVWSYFILSVTGHDLKVGGEGSRIKMYVKKKKVSKPDLTSQQIQQPWKVCKLKPVLS